MAEPGAGSVVGRASPAGTVTNPELFERALAVIPGGVNSPVRSFSAVGGSPYFVSRAEGAYVWDVEGRRLVDLVQSYGASIVGHAHPLVVEAVGRATRAGTSYGAPTEAEVLMAEAVAARVEGCEQLRLVSSGTEAAMSALRLARGFTGRDRVVKFAGCYHGHSDGLLAEGGSGVATLGLSGSAGVTASAVADTIVAPYNQVPSLDREVACVIVEPVAANMGLVAPVPGFLEGLRRACDARGALLVFDEVITGFRLGSGGAAAWCGVQPDLWCFGKVIGGGLPVGAFGGRSEVMATLAPLGPVFQAGTLSGNPVATAAGLAVLELLDDDAYSRLDATAAALAEGLRDALVGTAARVERVGPLIGLAFSDEPVRDYDGARESAGSGLYPPLFWAMLESGVALPPGPYEVLFPSLAHGPAEVEAVVEAAKVAAGALARASARRGAL